MKKNTEYILDLTNCYTEEAIMAAIEADLNARKQLGFCKVLKRKIHNLFK